MFPFKLTFVVRCEIRVDVHFFPCRYPVGPAPFIKKAFFSPAEWFDTCVENHLATSVCGSTSGVSFVNLDVLCLSVSIRLY